MNALIKFQITDNGFNTDRHLSTGRIYIGKSTLSDRLDKWFMDNKIFMLNFKCKTWNKMIRYVTKIESESIKKALNLNSNATVTYSRKAGCSCGCSPGYIVKNDCFNKKIWINFEYDITEFENMIPKFDQMLKKEIEANGENN